MMRSNDHVFHMFDWEDDLDVEVVTPVKPKILNLCQHNETKKRPTLNNDFFCDKWSEWREETLLGQANQELTSILLQNLPRKNAALSQTPPVSIPTPPTRAINPFIMNSPFARADEIAPGADLPSEGAELGLLSLSPSGPSLSFSHPINVC